jgi:hypothetical protein
MPHRKLRWRRLHVGGHAHGVDSGDNRDRDRWYSDLLDYLDIPNFGDLGDLGTVIAVIVGVVVAGLVMWFLVIPALLLLIDVAVLVLLLLAGVFAHVVLRRPWEVEASCRDRRLTWLVAGWKRSGQTVGDVETSLRGGVIPSGSLK